MHTTNLQSEEQFLASLQEANKAARAVVAETQDEELRRHAAGISYRLEQASDAVESSLVPGEGSP